MKCETQTTIFACLFLIIPFVLAPTADTVYVDLNLKQTCSTYRTYDSAGVIKTDVLKGNKKAYTTIQKAIDSTPAGMTVILREGIYQQNHIRLWTSKNGTAWTPGNYNTLQSMDGEWAIIDGKNEVYNRFNEEDTTLGCSLIGSSGGGATPAVKYWKFKRIEITGGKSKFQDGAGGFGADVGPFWFTQCYIHDNKANTGSLNSQGIGGYCWEDCIVEYCLFASNGSVANDDNSADITILSDYNHGVNGWAKTGFTFTPGKHMYRNQIRYNLFLGNSGTNVKHKGSQLFTGRNPAEGFPVNDTYSNLGDHIHHNICMNSVNISIRPRQDFAQVYNNIFINCHAGIGYAPDEPAHYKLTIYNNTLINSGGICTPHSDYYPQSYGEHNLYVYLFNNIVDGGQASWDGSSISSWRETGDSLATFDSLLITNNFFYRQKTSFEDPKGLFPIFVGNTAIGPNPYYTVFSYYVNFKNSTNWLNNYPGLFLDTIGAKKFITSGTYEVEVGKKIANVGRGGAHPFLSGIQVPTYIGATDPNDPNGNQWVSDVLALENLKDKGFKRPPVFGKVPTLEKSTLFADSVKKKISWEVNGESTIEACSLMVSYDSLKNWKLITVVKDSFSYSWRVPDTSTPNAFLKVIAVDANSMKSSSISSRFSIVNRIGIVKKELIHGAVGNDYRDTLKGEAGVPPYRWTITSGYLPASLQLDSLTGIISGVAHTAGMRPFRVQLRDSENHTVEENDTVIIDSLSLNEIRVTSPVIAGGPVFYADSIRHTISWTAVAYYNVALCSLYISLDSARTWLKLAETAGKTTKYEWLVTDTTASNCFIKVVAKDGSGNTAAGISTPFSILNSISIGNESLPATITGAYYSEQLIAISGIPPYKWKISSGALPGGIVLDSLAGVIAGAAKTVGIYGFKVLLRDAGNHTVADSFTIKVDSAAHTNVNEIKVTAPVVAGGPVFFADSVKHTISWTAIAYYKVALCSLYISLDSAQTWVKLAETDGKTSKYEWTVPDTIAHLCYIKVVAKDDSGNSATGISTPFSIINSIGIRNDTLPSTVAGLYYSEQLVAVSGIPPYRWRIASGRLPAGIVLDSLAGVVAGAAKTVGAFGFRVELKDAGNHTATDSFTIRVDSIPRGSVIVTSPRITDRGIVFADSVAKKISWATVSSFDIAICSLFVSLDSMRQWQMIDTVSSNTNFYSWLLPDTAVKSCFLKIKAVDDSGNSAIAISTPFEIVNKLSFKTTTLSSGIKGCYYREALLVATGLTPFKWRVVQGILPSGLILDSLTGIIFGIPDSTGNYPVSIRLSDNEQHSIDVAYTITISKILLADNIIVSPTLKTKLSAGVAVVDTFRFVVDSLKNTYTAYAGKGGVAAVKITGTIVTLGNGTKALIVTTPAKAVNDTTGMQAFIVVGNDTLQDTVSIAHPVKRTGNNFDNIVADSLVWTPLSVSATPDKNDVASVLSVFTEPGKTWNFDKTKFRIIQWVPSPATIDNQEQWVEGSVSNGSLFSFVPGRLFWIRTAKSAKINFGAATVAPVDLDSPVVIALHPHQWTDFALPFAFSVDLAGVIDATKAKLVANKKRVDELKIYSWQKENTIYKANLMFADSLILIKQLVGGPGNGYTVYNPGESFSLLIPPVIPAIPVALQKKESEIGGSDGFGVKFNFNGPHGGANPVVVCASEQHTGTSYIPEPPTLSSCRIAIIEPKSRKPYGNMFTGAVTDGGIMLTFSARNDANIAEKINTTINTMGTIPENFSIRFFSEAAGSFSTTTSSFPFTIPAMDSMQFIAGIGTNEFFTDMAKSLSSFTTGLNQVYVVPHTAQLMVNYTLPALAGNIKRVTCELIDLRGCLIKKFAVTSGFAPGVNRLNMDLRGRNGKQFNSAICLLRVGISGITGRKVFVKRVVMVR